MPQSTVTLRKGLWLASAGDVKISIRASTTAQGITYKGATNYYLTITVIKETTTVVVTFINSLLQYCLWTFSIIQL